jgi:uncharacterized protein YbjT (DUF2867 family)
MAILVTGSTGTIGSQVLAHLQGRRTDVRALTRSPETAQLPSGVTPVRGDLADTDSMRAALAGVSTLFLLAPNVADELTQTMLALTVAREAGVKGIVYLSVFKGEAYAEVPHFAGKYTVERMIEALDLPATILRPAYFIQNDLRQKDPLLKFAPTARRSARRGSRWSTSAISARPLRSNWSAGNRRPHRSAARPMNWSARTV